MNSDSSRQGSHCSVVELGPIEAWKDLYYIVIEAPQGGLAAAGTEDGVTVQRKVTWPGTP